MPLQLENIKDKFAGEEVWLVGNGPSVNQQDLSKLKKKHTFCSNQYFLNERIDWTPTLYAVEDRLGFRQHRELITENVPKGVIRFFEIGREKLVGDLQDTYFVRVLRNSRDIRFSENIEEAICSGFCVTYMQMQIAYYLGFKTINLIGIDHSRGHFCPEKVYHQGKKHGNQRLRVSRNFLKHGAEFLETKGVKVVDYTLNGNLNVVPRKDYELVD